MATKRKVKYALSKSGDRAQDILSGTLTIGSTGALSTAAGYLPKTATAGAFGVIKTATKTGRYSLKIEQKYKVLRAWAMLEGPADTGMGNTDANMLVVRNVATDGFDIQAVLASSGADTETTSGNKIHWFAQIKEY